MLARNAHYFHAELKVKRRLAGNRAQASLLLGTQGPRGNPAIKLDVMETLMGKLQMSAVSRGPLHWRYLGRLVALSGRMAPVLKSLL
jgi:hypothetical protein